MHRGMASLDIVRMNSSSISSETHRDLAACRRHQPTRSTTLLGRARAGTKLLSSVERSGFSWVEGVEKKFLAVVGL